jgi:reverse transcriptase-like protein
VAPAQRYLGEGYGWVVDLDLEKFFDRVNHDKRMSLAKKRVADRRVLQLIDRYLKAGALTDAGLEATGEGTPHGGPLSPLLANLLLDGLDQELERRGHRFVRDADDCHIYVKSVCAGQRVLASVTRFLARRLKWAVTAAQSAVDRPWRRTFLGFTFTGRRPNRRRVSEKALKACKEEVPPPDVPHARGVAGTRRRRSTAFPRGRVHLLWLCRDAVRLQGAGLLDQASMARLAVEARGSATLPATASPRRESGPGLEHGQVRPWAVAH